MALSLLLSVAYQVSISGEISTVQGGLSTSRVSHEYYIAFTRYSSDRLGLDAVAPGAETAPGTGLETIVGDRGEGMMLAPGPTLTGSSGAV